MKILFVNPYFKPYLGGIERVIEKLAEKFLQSGKVQKIGVLTTQWSFPRKFNADWKRHEVIDGVEVFRIKSWPHIAPPFSQVPLVWFSPLEIKNAIEQFQPDVIQLMSDKWVWGNFWVWVSQRLMRKQAKIVYSLSFHKLTAKQQWLLPFNFFLTHVVNKVHVITNYEKELVRKAYFTPDKKVIIIPWGIEVAARPWRAHSIKLAPQGDATTNKNIIILCVGRLSKHKGQEWLLRQYAEIAKNLSRETKLVFVGADESEMQNIKCKISNERLSEKVKIMGEVSQNELEVWYQKADIFALFPEYEAFGLVFLEAMSYGVPVLTHKVGAIEEILGDAVMLTEPYNAAQAKVALTKLIEDDKFRVQLGQKGYEYVKKKFSWQKTAERFLELYNSRIILR